MLFLEITLTNKKAALIYQRIEPNSGSSEQPLLPLMPYVASTTFIASDNLMRLRTFPLKRHRQKSLCPQPINTNDCNESFTYIQLW